MDWASQTCLLSKHSLLHVVRFCPTTLTCWTALYDNSRATLSFSQDLSFVLSLLTCLLLLFVLPQLQSRLLLQGYTSEGAARKSKAGLELGTVAVAIPTAHVMTPRVLTPLSPLFYQLSPLTMTPYLLQVNYLSISPIKPICTFTEKTLRLPETGRAMRWLFLARGSSKGNKRASVALELPRNTTAHLLTLFLFSFSLSTSNPFVRFSYNLRFSW